MRMCWIAALAALAAACAPPKDYVEVLPAMYMVGAECTVRHDADGGPVTERVSTRSLLGVCAREDGGGWELVDGELTALPGGGGAFVRPAEPDDWRDASAFRGAPWRLIKLRPAVVEIEATCCGGLTGVGRVQVLADED